MELSGPQIEAFCDTLQSAFPTPKELERMLKLKLDRNLNDISLETNLPNIVFDLIRAAEADGWTEDLLKVTRAAKPNNV